MDVLALLLEVSQPLSTRAMVTPMCHGASQPAPLKEKLGATAPPSASFENSRIARLPLREVLLNPPLTPSAVARRKNMAERGSI